MNFQKPEGEANTCVQFEYDPHKSFEDTRGKVSVSMNSDTINRNKPSKNQQLKYENPNLKEQYF